jgi:hypothetical protein
MRMKKKSQVCVYMKKKSFIDMLAKTVLDS